MSNSTTDVQVPSDYSGRTVRWAKSDLGNVGLGIRVRRDGGAYHSPGANEMDLIIQANAPGSRVGQSLPTGGNAKVVLTMV
jgi:hypothetical protein